jgi:hypothetical protein
MQTAANFNVKARLVSEILSPAKAAKFLQTDQTAKDGVLELLQTVGKVRDMMDKTHCGTQVVKAFNVLNEGQFVRFLDANKTALQQGKITGANVLETIVSIASRTKLSDTALQILADNTPQTAE